MSGKRSLLPTTWEELEYRYSEYQILQREKELNAMLTPIQDDLERTRGAWNRLEVRPGFTVTDFTIAPDVAGWPLYAALIVFGAAAGYCGTVMALLFWGTL